MNFITRTELGRWLDHLAEEKTLIAPRVVGGVELYRPVKNSQEMVWPFHRPILSVKEYFFPPTERLLTIKKFDHQVELIETLPKGEKVIFGVRPCDARGVKILDALFLEKAPVDPYYARRRLDTAVIGLACREMGPSCFCTSMGGAPDSTEGMDLLLTELEDGFCLEVISQRGEQLLEGVTSKMVSRETPRPRTGELVPRPQMDTWPAYFNEPSWARLAEGCLSCRICAYICPTCRCFDLRDESLHPGNGRNEYERIRCWDSCASEAYRRIAGGHNPRDEKGERLRNRFYCKFYYYSKQYGLGEVVACTGCGRCIDYCPVGIDITEVLGHVVEVGS